MNPFTSQDFQKAVDYTALLSVSGALLNQGFDGIKPAPMPLDDTQGLGMVITTIDTGADFPVVPNPEETADYEKWKRYLWNRIPALESGINQGTIYAWNDAIAPDAEFLKWVSTREDITGLIAQTDENTADILAATNSANTAVSNSSTALSTATTANTNATSAVNSVAAATAAATSAAAAATTALATANTANTAATAAQAAAANALTVAAGNKLVTQITPGTAGQQIRTSDGASPANEYFDVRNTIVILSESVAPTGSAITSIGAAFAGGAWTTRALTHEVKDTGALCTLAANAFTLLKGWYKVTAHVPFTNTNIAVAGIVSAISRLYNVTDGTADATSTFNNTTETNAIGVNYMTDVFYTDGTKSFRIETWASGGVATYYGGAGSFSLVGPPVNRFTMVELQKIG